MIQKYNFKKDYKSIQTMDNVIFGNKISIDELSKLDGYVYRNSSLNDELLGYILFEKADSLESIHIRSLAVQSDFRNKNLGSLLLLKVENRFPENVITLCIDGQWGKPDKLRKFYKNRGFEFTNSYSHNGNEIWKYNNL